MKVMESNTKFSCVSPMTNPEARCGCDPIQFQMTMKAAVGKPHQ
jgi:hypothetical protein